MRILEIDIETAPNLAHVYGLWNQTIGINQLVESGYTLCYSAKWLDSKDILFDSIFNSSPKRMVKGLWSLLDAADAIVHYNGSKFDIPTINKEIVQLRMVPPSPAKQIDLYKVVKRNFKFASNKLDYVSRKLGLGGKVQHKGHELWAGCMNKDAAAWKQMERYNKQDVVLLDRLYKYLLPWIHNHPNRALYLDTLSKAVCKNCGSMRIKRNGVEHTSVGTYQRYRCCKCGTPMRGRENIMDKNKKRLILL